MMLTKLLSNLSYSMNLTVLDNRRPMHMVRISKMRKRFDELPGKMGLMHRPGFEIPNAQSQSVSRIKGSLYKQMPARMEGLYPSH